MTENTDTEANKKNERREYAQKESTLQPITKPNSKLDKESQEWEVEYRREVEQGLLAGLDQVPALLVVVFFFRYFSTSPPAVVSQYQYQYHYPRRILGFV